VCEDRLQHLETLLGLAGLVALIIPEEDLIGEGIDHDELHRRTPHIESDEEPQRVGGSPREIGGAGSRSGAPRLAHGELDEREFGLA